MRRICAFLATSAIAIATPAFAGTASDWVEGGFSKARLITGEESRPGVRWTGVNIAMPDGWKTYWRAPGDTGVAPQLDWSGSVNVQDVKVHWPAPKKFSAFGMTSWGYDGEIILPVEVAAVDPTQPVELSLNLFYGVCGDVCAPEIMDLTLSIPSDAAADPVLANAIEAHTASVPLQGEESGLVWKAAAIEGEGEERVLQAVLEVADGYSSPMIVPEAPEGTDIAFGDAETILKDGAIHISIPAYVYDEAGLDSGEITLTVLDKTLNGEIAGPICSLKSLAEC